MQTRKELILDEFETVKNREHELQVKKEELLLMRKEHDEDIKERERIITAARENQPGVQGTKMFDEVFRLVDSCYHLQLLICELEEQVAFAKDSCEEKDSISLLKGLTEAQDVPENMDPSSVLYAWYQQMKKHVQDRSSQQYHCVDEDCFYNVRLSSDNQGREERCAPTCLTFLTRHSGYCLHLTIEETRSTDGIQPTLHHAFTSDIHLEGLELKGQEYLGRGRTAREFIMEEVWPLMDENISL
nr:uncharacterized protein LOC129265697 [Lytechinus pictus]